MRMLFAASSHEDLVRIIRSVRARWRLGMVLRGVSILVVAGLVAFLVSAYGMDRFRFNPTAVLIFRIVAYTALVAVTVRFLVLPLWKRVSDEQVALYLEEHEPSLKGYVLSGVEFGAEAEDPGQSGHSPALIRQLVRAAIERCVTIEEGRRVDRRRIVQSSGLLAGATMTGVLFLLLNPSFIRHSAPFLLAPWDDESAENPYAIEVSPGDVSLARGSDLRITATLRNFDSDEVELVVKRVAEARWDRWPMTVDEVSGEHMILLFDLDEATQYLVEASGVRSPLYRISVSDLPYVDRVDLEYRFPAYTGLSPQRQEDSGDIAALQGTTVVLSVVPTMEVGGGAIVINDKDTLLLEVGVAGVLTGTLTVRQEGLYRILLRNFQEELVVASSDYIIDVLEDQPPSLSFTKPGRDINVTAVEEVFAEVRAEDDYGIGKLELVYSVSGGPEQSQVLYAGGAARQQVTAGHTFFLEELDLEPGDFISYYAQATESEQKRDGQVAATDIYFMEVRPFGREYRQAEQQGGGMQGGAAGGPTGELSERQRDIIAGTFRMARDREQYSTEEFNENLTTLALAQGRLREDVQTLVQRLAARDVVRLDSNFQAVAEALPIAVTEMGIAEERLGERAPEDALSPEQKALQQLQRAEAAFRETQVSRGENRGGGGSGRQSDPEDLADLFDLELDRMRNQYERVQRGQQQQMDDELDEVQQKLKELAQRQQQENERLRARQQSLADQAAGGGGESQRRLAEETEELARQLERLARENSRPELDQTARSLREAAEEMRRAAANARNSGVAQGTAALDELREARRLLDQNSSSRLQGEVQDVLRRVQRLAEDEQAIISDVERLYDGTQSQAERIGRMRERKEEMAAEVADVETQLDRLGRESQRDQKDAARKLTEAAGSIRDTKLREKILYSRGVIETGSRDYARNFEQQIASDIAELEQLVEEGLAAIGESREQRLARSLDRTRESVNALESMNERLREAAEQQGQQQQQQQGQQPQGQGQQGQQQQGQQQQGQQAQRGQGQNEQGDPPQVGSQPPNQSGGPGRLRPGDLRQFSREMMERQEELMQLRQELEREGVDVSELDEVIADLRSLSRSRDVGDPLGLERLESEIIQGLKDFEYTLRKQLLGAEEARPFLAGSDDVPGEYRELVEEYYRELARSRRNRP